jgi:hypothetical protein
LINESNWGSILRKLILFFLKILFFDHQDVAIDNLVTIPTTFFFSKTKFLFQNKNLVATWIGVSTRTNNKSTLITILWQLYKFFKLEYVCHMDYDQSGPSCGPRGHPSPSRSTLVHMVIEFQLQKKFEKKWSCQNVVIGLWLPFWWSKTYFLFIYVLKLKFDYYKTTFKNLCHSYWA